MKDTLQDEVISANENFYRAIEESDYERMEELWVKSEDDKCVHPGWPMLYGWDAVGESWKSIFENGGPIGIELSDVSAQVSGDVAWVICIEKISHRMGDEIQSGFAQSTGQVHCRHVAYFRPWYFMRFIPEHETAVARH